MAAWQTLLHIWKPPPCARVRGKKELANHKVATFSNPGKWYYHRHIRWRFFSNITSPKQIQNITYAFQAVDATCMFRYALTTRAWRPCKSQRKQTSAQNLLTSQNLSAAEISDESVNKCANGRFFQMVRENCCGEQSFRSSKEIWNQPKSWKSSESTLVILEFRPCPNYLPCQQFYRFFDIPTCDPFASFCARLGFFSAYFPFLQML